MCSNLGIFFQLTTEAVCTPNQSFTFDIDSETNTLEMVSYFNYDGATLATLGDEELQEVTLVGFINDKDGKCSFGAASTESTGTIEGSVDRDGVLHAQLLQPVTPNPNNLAQFPQAFRGSFTKVPEELLPNPADFCFADGEECRTDDPDTVNGGCNYLPRQFGFIESDEPVCGTISTYVVKEGRKKIRFRDLDWFKFDWTGGPLTASLKAEFPLGEIFLEKSNLTSSGGFECESRSIIGFAIANRTDTSTDITLNYEDDLAAGTYVLIVSEDEFGDFDECGSDKGNAYTFTFGPLDTGIEATSSSAAYEGSLADVNDSAEGETTWDEEE